MSDQTSEAFAYIEREYNDIEGRVEYQRRVVEARHSGADDLRDESSQIVCGLINFAVATISSIALCADSASSRVSNEKVTSGRPRTPMMLKP